MGNIPFMPANSSRSSTIVYDGKEELFEGNITPGTGFNPILSYISQLIKALFSQGQLECIDLKDLGIECPDPNKSKECVVLEYLLANLATLTTSLSTLTSAIDDIQGSIGVFTDETVKIKATGKAGFLNDKLKAAPGVLVEDGDTLRINGTVPIGFTATISISRKSDFDATGKGKPGTDVWGWAFRNGNNGTENCFGFFPRYAVSADAAGKVEGNDSFTIDKTNIKSMTLPVNGIINDALDNNVSFNIPGSKRNHHGGLGEVHTYVVPDPGNDFSFKTDPVNFKHSHDFTLAASLVNVNPTPIDLIPKHITEIPIQRIIP